MKTAVVIGVLLAVLMVSQSYAEIGFYRSTPPIDEASMMIGGDLVFGSFGVLGHFRYGIAKRADLGFKTGFINQSDDTLLDFGADFKYAAMSVKEDYWPIDVSIAGVFDFKHLGEDSSRNNVSGNFFFFGAGAQAGRSFPISGSQSTISPYGALLLGIYHSDVSVRSYPGWDFSGGEGSKFGGLLAFGSEIRFNSKFSSIFELDITFADGSDTSASLGLNYFF
ncbi:MAG: hypothetical protein A2161_18365 [Candidatus Schekmanbacteria bacterium RBG_13_48_7]|uniref:Outer membrane protein beta-barrel domain-containing protein n=1 Tax=Candidatus Schekmanbacteria bacterium RBG_13_48_7 TaxID=1817878 RepID=A0A1F7RXJ2_9BACT|nr:MAG: hypothetical protein A2161_18365 [Candidatus Schekmanbacteria bacterium RBG_13_48_7]